MLNIKRKALAAGVVLAMSSQGFSAPMLEEVVVTAQKRE